MVFPWFIPWFSHGFPTLFLWFPQCLPHGFLMAFRQVLPQYPSWFSDAFLMFCQFLGAFPQGFRWVPHGFPWVSHSFPWFSLFSNYSQSSFLVCSRGFPHSFPPWLPHHFSPFSHRSPHGFPRFSYGFSTGCTMVLLWFCQLFSPVCPMVFR